MSDECCPFCGARFNYGDGPDAVTCPGCGGGFRRGSGEASLARGPGADPLAAYRGDTIAMPRTPARATSSSESFGPFDLVDRLGSSDVAFTYRARDRVGNRIVALKVFAPGRTASRAEVTAYVERARTARKLDGEHIVKVLDVGRHDETDYIATQYVQGKSLESVLEVKALTVTDALDIARSLGRAVVHAHSRGVVHGNIKPSNVILDSEDEPHLRDFGLARELWRLDAEDLKAAERAGHPLPYHISPEQLRGSEPTERSDVYSMGALLYHLVTGRPPFPADGLFELIVEVDRGRPLPPAEASLRVPPEVNSIIMKCLAREPADRFASAREFLTEIQSFLKGGNVRASVPGPVRRLGRALLRRWRAAAVVAVLAAGSAWGAWKAGRSERLALTDTGRAAAAIEEATRLAGEGELDAAAERFALIEARTDLPQDLRARAAACLGATRFRAGDHAGAVAALGRAVALSPRDAELRYLHGVSLWRSGTADPAEVATELELSLRLDRSRRDSPPRLYDYARALMEAGRLDEAADALRGVRRLDPSFRPKLVKRRLEIALGRAGPAVDAPPPAPEEN